MEVSHSLDSLKVIARIKTQFTEKFGIPRQSGIVEALKAKIIFEPEYRNPDALRGLEGFSHIWLLWGFGGTDRGSWSATVAPPRLGGKTRYGVFATRSPFRPNPIGLSSVELCGIEQHEEYGLVLEVAGADLLDDTPIYDIKPYLAYTDSHPDAAGGFAEEVRDVSLPVEFPDSLLEKLPKEYHQAVIGVLAHDPRPGYRREEDPDRIYGVAFAEYNIRFRIIDERLVVSEVGPAAAKDTAEGGKLK